MQFYFYIIDRESNGHKMVKSTCLIALKRKDQNPSILHLKILVDLLLKVFVRQLQNNNLNAQAYNHINAIIISIGIDWRERGYDSENFGARITWFGVTVEKIWMKEVLGAKWSFQEVLGVYLKFTECREGLGTKDRDIWGICEIFKGLNEILKGLGHICE
jgi:hypothetical protein